MTETLTAHDMDSAKSIPRFLVWAQAKATDAVVQMEQLAQPGQPVTDDDLRELGSVILQLRQWVGAADVESSVLLERLNKVRWALRGRQ